MNKYIEEYISKRKQEIAEEELKAKQKKKATLLKDLNIGVIEYRTDFPNEPAENFPNWDSLNAKYYRNNIGEITDEEYSELLKYVPDKSKDEKSGWHTFATVKIILGGIAVAISLFLLVEIKLGVDTLVKNSNLSTHSAIMRGGVVTHSVLQ